jgi:hypothetical protein
MSAALPLISFGTTHALLRVDSVTWLRRDRWDSSTVMSAALLPSPTTRTRLSMRCSGVHGSM